VIIVAYYLFGYYGGKYNIDGGVMIGANLLDFFVPIRNYSLFIGDHELSSAGGWAYLGCGIYLILICLIIAVFRSKKNITILLNGINTNYVIIILMILVYIYSLSNNIYIGKSLLHTFYINTTFSHYLGIFRACERFIWVSYYIILILTFISLNIIFKQVKNKIIFIALLLQCIDIYPLFISMRHEYSPNKYDYINGYEGSAWNIDKSVRHMYIDPNFIDQFKKNKYGNSILYSLANLAIVNNLTINNYYLARRSIKADNVANQTFNNIAKGVFESNTIYIMDSSRSELLQYKKCEKVTEYIICR
jgi:hypothetical protein